MVTGFRVITSPAVSVSTSAVRVIRRRRSPSVMTPTRRPSSSTTQVMPSRLLDISWMTSGIGVDAATIGAASPRVHRLLDPHQPPAELAARMQGREVLLAEALAHQQRHRERVAERQRRGGARGRHQVHRTRFLGDAAVERDVGRLRQRRRGSPVIAISRAPMRRIDSSSRMQLLGLAAVRQRQHHVVVADARRDRRGSLRPGAGRTPACRCSRASRRSCGR